MSKTLSSPKNGSRRDLIIVGVVVLVVCAIVLRDPDRVFEWLAQRNEAQFNEFLVAVVVIGVGFAFFSWRRWADLSRQVAEYQRLQSELTDINRRAPLISETDDLLQSCLTSSEAYKIVIGDMYWLEEYGTAESTHDNGRYINDACGTLVRRRA